MALKREALGWTSRTAEAGHGGVCLSSQHWESGSRKVRSSRLHREF